MERAEVRFNNLCVEDKLRLQKLIKELATASQQLNQKNERIEKLEIDLAEKQKDQARIDLERKGIKPRDPRTASDSRSANIDQLISEALEKAAGVKQMYSVLRSELHDQQDSVRVVKSYAPQKYIKLPLRTYKSSSELIKVRYSTSNKKGNSTN